MPRTCDSCDNWHNELCKLHHDKFMKERHPDCPLVEVKSPHGKLVDADAIEYVESEDGPLYDYAYHVDVICLPTIIEAEGKDNGK